MSVSIDAASPNAQGLAEAMDAARPEVRSRRMSFRLGPLGVSYASDQVLWGAAAGAKAASAPGASDNASDNASGNASDARFTDVSAMLPGADADDTAQARRAEAERTAQTQARQVAVQQSIARRASVEEASGRSFDGEMFAAWRRRIGQRVAGDATYGPDGTLRGVADAAGSMDFASGGAVEGAEEGGGEPAADADPVATVGTTVSTAEASARESGGLTAARMRRAIAAYLSCAAGGSSGRSMLTAVA